jgi:hypothetical protein
LRRHQKWSIAVPAITADRTPAKNKTSYSKEVHRMLYTSEARKEGDWWIVQSDQEPRAISQVAELDQATEAQREAIAFVADVPAESIDVIVRISDGPDRSWR